MRARSVVVAAAMLLAGCGSGGDDGADPVAGGLDPATLTGAAPAVDGATVELSAFAGKDLVVWFWAPW